MSTIPLSTPVRRRTGTLRTGLVLGALLGVLDIVAGTLALTGGFFAPPDVGAVMIALGAATVALVPFAWSGRRRWAAWIVAASRLLSSAAGVPAFLVPGVPVSAIVSAAAGILVAVVVAVLIAFGVAGARR